MPVIAPPKAPKKKGKAQAVEEPPPQRQKLFITVEITASPYGYKVVHVLHTPRQIRLIKKEPGRGLDATRLALENAVAAIGWVHNSIQIGFELDQVALTVFCSDAGAASYLGLKQFKGPPDLVAYSKAAYKLAADFAAYHVQFLDPRNRRT